MEVKVKHATKVIAGYDLDKFEEDLNKFINDDTITIVSIEYSTAIDDEENPYFSALVVYNYTEPA